MRDLVEIGTLLDYFTVQPEKVARWREVSNDERLCEFRPADLRRALDERDGFTGGKRKADCQAFSEHAARRRRLPVVRGLDDTVLRHGVLSARNLTKDVGLSGEHRA